MINSKCFKEIVSVFILSLLLFTSPASAREWRGGGGMEGGGGNDGGGGGSSTTSATGNPNFTGPHFSGSENCASCHNNLSDTSGNDVSIINDWETSMMANSTRDPYWRAKVASELDRAPHLSDVINDKCSRCHAPMANVQAERDGAVKEIFGDGFLNPSNPYFDEAMDGVSCSLCHQIEDDGLMGTLEGTSGHYSISTATGSSRPAYGQFTNVRTGEMRNRVGYTPQYAAHISTSETCATCHDLKTPFVDADGNVASTTKETEFAEQMPFTEWKNSDYAVGGSKEASCQDCHMPKTTAPIANMWMSRRNPRSGFAEHTMLGANTVMIDILNNNREALGVRAPSSAFDQRIVNTRAFLETSADIEVISANVNNGELTANIRVTNNTGHKLPTAYPSRRAWIYFEVKQNGTTIFESGAMNGDGSIQGVAVDEDFTTYEPHYDVITSADQVQVYEPIMGDTDGNVNHALLRGAQYLKDNRIPPSGFIKQNAPNDVAVFGAANNDGDFDDGSDTVTYRIPVSNSSGITITAKLMYQPQSFGHLNELFQDDHLPQVAEFKAMFENRNILSETLSETSMNLN